MMMTMMQHHEPGLSTVHTTCVSFPQDFRFGSEHSSPGAVLVKPPGSINGQQFIIEDLTQCEVRVLDRSDCTQVDHCVDSEITLGPVDGSLFARDCKGCTFHVAARQFRMRDCTDCTVCVVFFFFFFFFLLPHICAILRNTGGGCGFHYLENGYV
jgi:hypothetical protein